MYLLPHEANRRAFHKLSAWAFILSTSAVEYGCLVVHSSSRVFIRVVKNCVYFAIARNYLWLEFSNFESCRTCNWGLWFRREKKSTNWPNGIPNCMTLLNAARTERDSFWNSHLNWIKWNICYLWIFAQQEVKNRNILMKHIKCFNEIAQEFE